MQSFFCTKSKTPACMLASTDSTRSSLDSMMTATLESKSWMRRETSSPSTSGMFRSQTTTSGMNADSLVMASSPLVAVSTCQPASSISSDTTSRVMKESSTSSRRPVAVASPAVAPRAGAAAAGEVDDCAGIPDRVSIASDRPSRAASPTSAGRGTL
jgi:hypothetical protein